MIDNIKIIKINSNESGDVDIVFEDKYKNYMNRLKDGKYSVGDFKASFQTDGIVVIKLELMPKQ
jgi:hypothetical protein